ncbi:phosphoribosylaminoimidazolesuccinocarboxamide synthase [Spelaeicoccus albus]|uniref:Phosphoribosylaminoimidazole-succinocarboxamide synthase n=1 Tax=Spelaeicoccus albus TaxID=1280376 RepID=A0A7Z0A816_9MICO|nr:phosphoribosylaminoimidazolesuccinocarboxamide synthase [Spelaeicoccus albus]NYI66134.1 phosphoribosylaminoimidazole-succinocarboxamide synthase [Spelaeicoccus albus]
MNENQAIDVAGWTHVYSGKVRDLYEPSRDAASEWAGRDVVLVVASDRISAYDHVLASTIPDKGAVLTQLSLWWFDQLDGVANHVVSTDVPDVVAGRAMICRKLDMFKVECVARGYLTGSGLADYRASGTVCGVPLPDGLEEASVLPEPIFTPAAKADLGEHDENIDFATMSERLGAADAAALRNKTLSVYGRAAALASERGIILADTKFEFGRDRDSGDIVLGDEVLTPDSSRFWDADGWAPGRVQPSFDKQFVRDWLTGPDSGWDRNSDEPPPALPDDVIAKTRERYVEAYELLTGTSF